MAGGAIAFPIAVLLHELGHFAGYSVFGFPDPVLSFASTGWADVQFDALMAAGTWRLQRQLLNRGRWRSPGLRGLLSPTLQSSPACLRSADLAPAPSHWFSESGW